LEYFLIMLSSILPWDVYPRLQNKPFGECFYEQT
jgi:hypothetical protein